MGQLVIKKLLSDMLTSFPAPPFFIGPDKPGDPFQALDVPPIKRMSASSSAIRRWSRSRVSVVGNEGIILLYVDDNVRNFSAQFKFHFEIQFCFISR